MDNNKQNNVSAGLPKEFVVRIIKNFLRALIPAIPLSLLMCLGDVLSIIQGGDFGNE